MKSEDAKELESKRKVTAVRWKFWSILFFRICILCGYCVQLELVSLPKGWLVWLIVGIGHCSPRFGVALVVPLYCFYVSSNWSDRSCVEILFYSILCWKGFVAGLGSTVAFPYFFIARTFTMCLLSHVYLCTDVLMLSLKPIIYTLVNIIHFCQRLKLDSYWKIV